MSALVIHADARTLPLPGASVDLIVTSPPYFSLRSYQDDGEHYAGQVGSEATPEAFLATLWDCTREWIRVLKPSGSLWVNLGDKYGPNKSLLGLPWRYAIGCTDQLGLILRGEVVWSKPNGMPESVTDRVRRSHEQWFHLTVEPRYFAALDNVREPHQATKQGRNMADWKAGPSGNREIGRGEWAGETVRDFATNPLGKVPGSVWTIAAQPLRVPENVGVKHFAAFPVEWPRRIITGWSPVGGVVLDPFGGTGTTALVASVLGRTGISVDLSHDYGRIAKWRTTDPQQRQKVRDKQLAAQPRPLTIDDERPAA